MLVKEIIYMYIYVIIIWNFCKGYCFLFAIMNYVYTFNPFSLGELPISLSVDEYYGYEMVESEISESEAMEQAYDSLRLMIDSTLPDAQILRKAIQGEFVDGKYVLKCTITAICDIAKQVEFEVLD